MKKIFLIVVFCITSFVGFSQLTGVKTIPGDYATIALAIADLNLNGVGAGGVTFNVATGHTETTSAQLTITATGTLANPIVFQKSGVGANPKITRTDVGTNSTSTLGGLGDAVVRVDGTDCITVDAIDVAASDEGIEYGYFTYKTATDGCQNVTIKNCAITLTKGTSQYVIGIYISNGTTSVSSATGVVVSVNSGRNENINIQGNTISNVHAGIYCRGYSASYDQNINIGANGAGNTIQNFGGGFAATTYGIYFIYINNVYAGYNTINNTAGGGTPHTSGLTGISITTANTASGILSYRNNDITLNANGTAACNWLYNANSFDSISIHQNTFGGTSASTAASYVIYNSNTSAGVRNIDSNTVTSISKTSATGSFYGINSAGTATGIDNIFGNNFSNFTLSGSGLFYAIQNTTNAAHTQNIYNNIVSNISGGTGTRYGIYCTAANTRSLYNNKVYNIVGVDIVYGIVVGSGGNTKNDIYNNTIGDLSSGTGTTTNGIVSGLLFIATGTTTNIYNNIIGNLTAPFSASTDGIRGISFTGTTASTSIFASFNTIYINASSLGANFGTSGIFHTYSSTSSTSNFTMRNNLVVNTSTASGTGVITAFRRSSATDLNNYNTASSNNMFYSGVPSASKLLFYDGTNSDQTIVQMKARLSPGENNSVTEMPNFLSTTATDPTFLHLNTLVGTRAEGGGVTVSGILDDIDGNVRNVSTPDIGADEFSGNPIDEVGPTFSFTPIPNTASISAPSFNNVIISDPSGLHADKPRLYYKKSTNANAFVGNTSADDGWKFVESNGVTSPFDFTLDFSLLNSAVVSGEEIQYFLVASDNAGVPNIGISNGLGFTAPPSSVALTGAAFPIINQANSYFIYQVYTWSGGATGSWSTAGNWTPSRTLPTDADEMNINTNAIITGVPTTTIGKLNISGSASVSLQPLAASNTLTLKGNNLEVLNVGSGSSLLLTHLTNALTIAFAGTAPTGTVNGTLGMTATDPTYPSVINFSGATLTINGTFINGGTITGASATTIIFADNSTYNHARNAGTIPTASINANAGHVNYIVSGIVSSVALTPPASIKNFTWNCPNQTSIYSSGSTITSILGNVTIENTGTGTYSFGNSATTQITGTTTINGGKFTFAGTSGAGVGFNGGLTVNAGGLIQATTSSTCSASSVSVASGGSINAGTGVVALTMNITGNLTNSGTLDGVASGGLLINYTGTGDQDFSNTGSVTNKVNMTMNKASGTLSFITDYTVNSSSALTLTAGSLVINPAKILTIAGTSNFTNNSVTLKSTVAGTASIAAITGSLSGATNVTVERYIPGGRRTSRFLGHPFSTALDMSSLKDDIYITGPDASFDATTSSSPSAYWFDNSVTQAWTAFTSTSDASWTQHRGIRVLVRGDRTQPESLTGAAYTPNAVTLDMTGTLNTGNQSVVIPIDYSVVANPYPSAVDIGTRLNATTNIGTQYWVWDANAGPSAGAYVTKLTSGGAYNLAMNGAFVVSPVAGTTINFVETDKQTTPTANLFRTNTLSGVLELKVLYNNYPTDNMFVRFNTSSNDNQEIMDGLKLLNPEVNMYALSADNKKLSLDTRPFADNKIIPMGFTATKANSFKIAVADYGITEEVYLKDKYLNVTTQLLAGTEYSFSVDPTIPASLGENRFELMLKTSSSTTNQFCNCISSTTRQCNSSKLYYSQ
jgi:hypothetical protein